MLHGPPVDTIRRIPRVPQLAEEIVRAAASAEAEARKKRRAPWSGALSLVIFIGIVVGVPKLLSWALQTPHPMAAITSGSMWPTFKVGSLVFIEGVQAEEIRVGDIVVFRNPENASLTIHRVVRREGDTLTTKGDANFKEDVPVKVGDVVGRTLTAFDKPVRIPYLGSLTMFAGKLRAGE